MRIYLLLISMLSTPLIAYVSDHRNMHKITPYDEATLEEFVENKLFIPDSLSSLNFRCIENETGEFIASFPANLISGMNALNNTFVYFNSSEDCTDKDHLETIVNSLRGLAVNANLYTIRKRYEYNPYQPGVAHECLVEQYNEGNMFGKTPGRTWLFKIGPRQLKMRLGGTDFYPLYNVFGMKAYQGVDFIRQNCNSDIWSPDAIKIWDSGPYPSMLNLPPLEDISTDLEGFFPEKDQEMISQQDIKKVIPTESDSRITFQDVIAEFSSDLSAKDISCGSGGPYNLDKITIGLNKMLGAEYLGKDSTIQMGVSHGCEPQALQQYAEILRGKKVKYHVYTGWQKYQFSEATSEYPKNTCIVDINKFTYATGTPDTKFVELIDKVDGLIIAPKLSIGSLRVVHSLRFVYSSIFTEHGISLSTIRNFRQIPCNFSKAKIWKTILN